MINLKKTLIAALAATAATSAMANGTGAYFGAGAGYGEAKDACEIVNTIPVGSCDDNNDNLWSVFGGYKMGSNFAIEAGYSDLGTYHGSVVPGLYGNYSARAYDTSLLAILPMGEYLNFYARGGYSLVNANTNLHLGTASFDDGGDEGAWTYGAGVGVNVMDNVEIRGDWKRYKDVDNNSSGSFASGSSVGLNGLVNHVDLDVYSLQAVYYFDTVGAPAAAPAEEVSLNIQVLFDTDKSNIKPEYAGEIQKAVDFLTAHPEAKAVIEGHTDSTASDAYNQGLSERRANSVMNAIVAKGIDAGRLSAVGYGESKPVADNATKEGRAQNRRVVAEFEGVSIKAE